MNKTILALYIVSTFIALYGIYKNLELPTTPSINHVPYELLEQISQSDEHRKEYKLRYTGDQDEGVPNLISIIVEEESENELSVIISDQSSFYVPNNDYFPSNKVQFTNKKANYRYSVLPNSDTLFTVERVLNDGKTEPIFDTKGKQFRFGRYYSTIGTSLNNNYLYGFGERRKKFRYDSDGNYTTYPKDQYGQLEFGEPNDQLYGYHPMWLKKELSGNFHIGFLKSTSPLLTEIKNGKSMQLHIDGGVIHLKFFLGDSNPENVVKAYHNYINGYSIQPFWSMGYHNSRWGYKSSKELIQIRDQFDLNQFPIEVLWNDLDYMQDYKQFTLQPLYVPSEMNELTDISKSNGIYWVPLIDIGIEISTDAAHYGIQLDAFLKSSLYKQTLIGCVWPGQVHYPDFNHPNSYKFWSDSLTSMKTKLGLNPGGFWIDMNEMSNFIPGEKAPGEECPGAEPPVEPITKPAVDDRRYLPFSVGGSRPLAHKSVTLTTPHYTGPDALVITDQTNILELQFHPLSSLIEAKITHETLQNLTGNPLTFSLTRGTFYGSGRYAAHWTGDNLAQWSFLKLAVSELLPFQLFGIPFVGQDVCGFALNTTAELCTRWMQLGAWSPFVRNHNSNVSIAQEPFQFPDHSYALPAMRNAFQRRYRYLKWMYSLFIANWNKDLGFGSGTVMRPLWWNYPSDEKSYDYEDLEFILGTDILVAPVLNPSDSNGSVTLDVYLPKGDNWIDMTDELKPTLIGGRAYSYILNPIDDIPYFQRVGSTIPIQKEALRTRQLTDVFTLQIALKQEGQLYTSQGTIMTISSFDEKSVYNKCLKDKSCIANIDVQGELVNDQFTGFLKFIGKNTETFFESIHIEKIIVFGISSQPITIELDKLHNIQSPSIIGLNFSLKEQQ